MKPNPAVLSESKAKLEAFRPNDVAWVQLLALVDQMKERIGGRASVCQSADREADSRIPPWKWPDGQWRENTLYLGPLVDPSVPHLRHAQNNGDLYPLPPIDIAAAHESEI